MTQKGSWEDRFESQGWTRKHPLVGARTAKKFENHHVECGIVVGYLPASSSSPTSPTSTTSKAQGKEEDDDELFHIVYDDGDEEDLERHEIIEQLRLFRDRVPPHAGT